MNLRRNNLNHHALTNLRQPDSNGSTKCAKQNSNHTKQKYAKLEKSYRTTKGNLYRCHAQVRNPLGALSILSLITKEKS